MIKAAAMVSLSRVGVQSTVLPEKITLLLSVGFFGWVPFLKMGCFEWLKSIRMGCFERVDFLRMVNCFEWLRGFFGWFAQIAGYACCLSG